MRLPTHFHLAPKWEELSFPCQLNTFRKRVKNVLRSYKQGNWSGDWVCISEVMWSELTVKWFCFEVKWSEVKWREEKRREEKRREEKRREEKRREEKRREEKRREESYIEVLGDKSIMHIRVNLYWGYLIVLWLFYLVCILYCGCFNLFCSMWVCVCVCFVMSGFLCVWVL